MRSGTRHHINKHVLVGALVGFSLIAAACGSDDASPVAAEAPAVTEAPAATEAPAVTEADATDAPDQTSPQQRIVSLSPTATEMMFAIGAGDLLVAVDDFSNYPAEALELPNELSGFEPNVEAIASYEPDLVLTGGDFTGLGDQLDDIGIASWDGPAASTLDDVYAQIEQLGATTGHVAEATELVLSMQTRLEEILANAPQLDEPLTIFHELDTTGYTIDSTTFVGDIYTMFGLHNIADRADGDNFGYPQLNTEFLITANPDLIFLADTKCCDENAAKVSARDGWDSIAAVQNGNIIEMDDDIASRWGPRIIDYIEAVAAAIERALVAT